LIAQNALEGNIEKVKVEENRELGKEEVNPREKKRRGVRVRKKIVGLVLFFVQGLQERERG